LTNVFDSLGTRAHALRHATALGAALALLLVALAAFAQDRTWQAKGDDLAAIPPLAARVTDVTNTLSAAEKQALETKLADWEQRTGNQLVVLIVATTKPEPIESYSIRVAEAWKIGRKGQDNGAIFLVAKDDHRMRIEVGYGLEGVLTDLTSHRIIDETVAPLFRQNRFAEGINAGVDRIISVVGSGEPLAPKANAKSSPNRGFDFGELLIFLFIAVPIIGGILSRIFGRVLGSGVGGGVLGAAASFIAGSIAIGVGVGILAFLVMLLFSAGRSLVGPGGMTRTGRGGVWFPGGGGFGGGGFGGGGGGGGGFSGGGGSFGGGGASGGW
jgi:uncharacterized protein